MLSLAAASLLSKFLEDTMSLRSPLSPIRSAPSSGSRSKHNVYNYSPKSSPMMRKAASNLRIAFNSPALPKLADHDEWSDSEVDENTAMTPLQIKRDSNGLMKLVATPKPAEKVNIDAPVGGSASDHDNEEGGATMTLMQARQFRGLRMALHASKMQAMRTEVKIAALTAAKVTGKTNYMEMKEKLSLRLTRMTATVTQAKDTIRMLEKENDRLEMVAELAKFNDSTSWLLPTSIAVATFCFITSFALSPAFS